MVLVYEGVCTTPVKLERIRNLCEYRKRKLLQQSTGAHAEMVTLEKILFIINEGYPPSQGVAEKV